MNPLPRLHVVNENRSLPIRRPITLQPIEVYIGRDEEALTLAHQLADTCNAHDELVKALRAAYAMLPAPDHTGDITVVPHPLRGVEGISKPDAENTCGCAVHVARRLCAQQLAKLGVGPMKVERAPYSVATQLFVKDSA